MDGFLRKGKPDARVQDALHQRAKGIYNDRLKEKDRHIKLAWSCAGANAVVAAIAVGGCIYLGTLPKSSVEHALLDPLGYSVRLYQRDMSTGEREDMKRRLVENFIRNLRETYPADKAKQERAVLSAIRMTLPDTPAWNAGASFFTDVKPYERMKTEGVTINISSINRVGDNTWHVEVEETIRDLRSMHAVTKKFPGVIITQERTDVESMRRTPLGLFVYDFSFDDKRAAR